jgi:hypothetical protein
MADILISTVGFFWRKDHVFWGAGSSAGKLLGVPAKNVTANPIDFREHSGIYVLYSDYKPIYVGQCGLGNQQLLRRLKQHRIDDLAERWDRFSWFGIRRVKANGKLSAETSSVHPSIANVLNHVEGVLIHAIEPPMNGQKGRFGNRVIRFVQVRDPRLGPETEEMLRLLCNGILSEDEQVAN